MRAWKQRISGLETIDFDTTSNLPHMLDPKYPRENHFTTKLGGDQISNPNLMNLYKSSSNA